MAKKLTFEIRLKERFKQLNLKKNIILIDQESAIAPKIGCTPETLRVWYQKYLDQQNPVKIQQISDQEKMKGNPPKILAL
jgi:hypothetical protein